MYQEVEMAIFYFNAKLVLFILLGSIDILETIMQKF